MKYYCIFWRRSSTKFDRMFLNGIEWNSITWILKVAKVFKNNSAPPAPQSFVKCTTGWYANRCTSIAGDHVLEYLERKTADACAIICFSRSLVNRMWAQTVLLVSALPTSSFGGSFFCACSISPPGPLSLWGYFYRLILLEGAAEFWYIG